MFPDVVQFEVTNTCNLSCVMCVRRTWRAQSFGHMDFNLYKRVIDEGAGKLRRVVLYGFGEPLTHPLFPEFVRYARSALGDNAYVLTVTNGTLVDARAATEVFEAGIDEVAFSIDAPDVESLSAIRVGSESFDVLKNLRAVSELKLEYGARLGISTVLMRSNYRMLPRLVEQAAEAGVDYVVASHVVPYHPDIVKEAVYTTASAEAVKFYKQAGQKLGVLAREALYDAFLSHFTWQERGSRQLYLSLLEGIARKGYALNYELVEDALLKEQLLRDVEDTISAARDIATVYGLEVKLPSVYADAKSRECPYVKQNATMILRNGEVVPCMDLAYEHPLYTNMHAKIVKQVSFGNVSEKPLSEIWSSEKYVGFRALRSNLTSTTPWCADCSFSTRKCWYIETNDYDCFGNEVGCSECLYSANLAHCII